ncbi:MAG: sigma-54 dependent transcriptional regulator [Proteobacteria bacterium]|nr:sigma-54 dependent transcriptional regulator [Pseudomonadota bacterium]MBU1686914.1 sigma-54 dependent transcriptional regulator [Pseudomonadota bacterium]
MSPVSKHKIPPVPKIYILDDEVITVQRLVKALGKGDYEVEGFISGKEALNKVLSAPPDLILMDIRLQDADGIDLMQRMRAAAPDMEVILMTGYAAIDQAVEATKKGAFNYLEKPIKLQTVRDAINEALVMVRQKRQKNRIYQEIRGTEQFGEIIGASPAMKSIFKTITQVAPLDCSVLLQGESGTGKELIARALHGNSPRRDKPFVSFNCGAFTDELIANELFGHEKGAFTGAVSTKLGLLETAEGGTVFLDEIGEMPLALQVKLLRVIQERNYMRVGGTASVAIDVRFIAATNRNLEKMVVAKEFRQDLYYRLKVVMIELPTLRQRIEDIPLLAGHFVRKAAARFSKKVPILSKDVLSELARYSFPGNVRELENIMERAVALCQGNTLKLANLPPDMLYQTGIVEQPQTAPDSVEIKDLEMSHISKVYRETGYNQTETARRLGISRTTLWRRLRNISPNQP